MNAACVTLPAGGMELSESLYIQDDWGCFQKISLNSALLDFLIFSISLLEFRDFRK